MAIFLTPLFTAERLSAPMHDDRLKALDEILGKLEGAGKEGLRLKSALAAMKRGPDTLADLEKRLVGTLESRLLALRDALGAQSFTLADLPEEIRSDEIAADGRARVNVIPAEDARDPKALQRFVESVRAVYPDATGSTVTIYESGQAVVKAFWDATFITMAALLLLLVLVLRNVRDVALVFAPLIMAALLLSPVSVLAGLPFNFANVIVLPLLFGIGIANGIQFVARERLEKDASKLLTSTTPRAVFFSALTTMVSFGSLALSSHPGTRDMGLLLAIALAFTLVCTVIVLPALMMVFPRKWSEECAKL
jgi:hypothetical protein